MATKGVGFVRRLWHEKPDIAASLCLCVAGFLGLCHYQYIYDKDTHHQHRWEYTVIRKEDADPRLHEKQVYN